MKTTLGMTLLATTLFSTGAHALTKNIKLDLNQAHMRGHTQIPVTKLLAMQGEKPNRGWKIKEVKIEAKSKKGHAQVALKVGHNESFPQTIPGTPENFEDDYIGFTTISLDAPHMYRGERQKRANLVIDGNVKAKSLKVKLNKKLTYDYTDDYGEVYSTAAEFKANKVIGSSKKIGVHGDLYAIKLKGTKGKVTVNKVTIVFSDGEKVEVDELKGKLKANRAPKVFTLKRSLMKPVKKIMVDASSSNIFGSRGKLAVELAK